MFPEKLTGEATPYQEVGQNQNVLIVLINPRFAPVAAMKQGLF
jgi:hypothetical protein